MAAAAPPDELSDIRARVLPAYAGWQDEAATALVAPFGNGLINQTYLLSGASGRAVLQRVSPIFSPEVHLNILAVTQRLAEVGMVTPRLVATRAGAPCLALGDSVWRILTHVDGVSFDIVGGAGQARAAGVLIARFHAALDDLPHRFVGMRLGVHDTAQHLARLDEAVAAHPAHRLAAQVAPLAVAIRAGARTLPPLPALPPRVCHGDLKFNNILFAGAEGAAREQPVCLIDLDVVGPLSLAFELGDAWRSWCNRAGEDDPEAALDLEIFRASLDGYCAGRGRGLTADERGGLLLGVEWVSLGLAARFAADALRESYFGWDPRRFPGRGEHNLLRARGQWSLHQLLVASRPGRAAALASTS
ncbi:MAG TPA: aminoglycoside phosphotransferase family protein [Polyangia bacterium]|jgi:Ser/Thr protein kinase RdoA (MazF antagonist)|nr:aminoglycoside phosphotransferase family protein [Polyangia bacterium]